MELRRIRLDISYDGTNYAGWQVQDNNKTVQGEIEKSLKRLINEDIRIHGSGRTDSGVHADVQVAHFDTENFKIPANKFKEAINSRISKDIRILSSSEVSFDFHARYSARVREYKYYFNVDRICSPKDRLYCFHLGYLPDVEKLNNFAMRLVGIHDFTAFSSIKDVSPVKIRKIYSASFFFEGKMLVFKITGNAFLWKMVRSIVGTLIMMERKGVGTDYLDQMFDSGNRALAGTVAPSCGLFFHRVFYDGETVNNYERF
ncbi:MAG: tRNA pseudouridine(38-40) synthase TruA [Spirochaetales bacterium]|nr:tRNA pseudouridine(38-40) synthase TruA [Spirochaetales bacterium]